MKKMKAIFSLLLVLCCMLQFAAPMAMADGDEAASSPLTVEVWGWDSDKGAYAKPVDNAETEDIDESKKFEGEYALDPVPATVEELNENGTVISVNDAAYYVNSIILKSEGKDDVYVGAKFAGGDGAYYKELYIKPGTVSALNEGAAHKLVLCVSEEPSAISLSAGEVSGLEFAGASGVISFNLPSLSEDQEVIAAQAGKAFNYWQVSYPNGMSLEVNGGATVPVFGSTTATAVWNDINILVEPEKSITVKPKAPTFFSDANNYIDTGLIVSKGELSEGHSLNPDAFEMKVETSEDGSKVTVKLSRKEGAAAVLGADGADVSEIYDITLENRGLTKPVLTVTAKAPKLNSDGDEYVTDGYTNTELEAHELINDEGVVLAVKYSEDESKVKVTAKAAEGKPVVKNTEGSDISNKYHIVFADSAEIDKAAKEVVKTDVTISAKNPKFDVAKGKYVEDGFKAITGLAEGHRINEDNLSVDLAFSTDGKAIEVRISCDEKKPYIVDKDGKDVTKFYNVTVDGPVEFKLPVVTITANKAKLNEDGDEYIADGATATGLIDGDVLNQNVVKLTVKLNSDKTTVTVKAERAKGGQLIRSADGKDVEDKYVVEYKDSVIDYELEDKGSIDKVDITIKASNRTAAYNGKLITAEKFTITTGKLKTGHKVAEIEYDGGATFVTKKGEEGESLPCNIVIEDADGTDVTVEYNIEVKPGKITVTPADVDIVITANSAEKEYDGTPLEDRGVTVEGDLCKGDEVVARAVGSATKPGDAGANRVVYNGSQKWRIYNADAVDVTDCYNKDKIKLVDGKLTINPREATVTAIEKEVVYDKDTSYKLDETYFVFDNLLEGHVPYIEAQFAQDGKAVSAPKKAGFYDIEIKKVVIKDADKKDVTNCYDIETENGYLLIKPSEDSYMLTITAPDYEWTYDGKNHRYHSMSNILFEGLEDGDEVESVVFSESSVINDAGSVANVIISAKVVDVDGKPVDGNKYAIKFVPGTLTVKKFDITVTAESASKKYDGTALVNKNVTVSKLANTDHKISIDYSVLDKDGNVTTAKYPGVYTKKITSVKITDANGKDVTASYNIEVVNGTLTITGEATGGPVQTGDESNLGLLIGVMAVCLVAVAVIVVVIIKKNKKKPEDDAQV